MSDFVHLHCHTEYSLLDGAIKLKDLVKRTQEFGLSACCITDHGNLYGAAYFYRACKDAGLKPIIGCEVYVCHDHTDKTSPLAKKRNHLILLAENNDGYHNLVKLVTHGALDGFYYKPRVDKEMLRKYSEGLICLSACIAGEIPRAIMANDMDLAQKLTEEYSSIYPGKFYLELHSNGLLEQEKANAGLMELAQKNNLPLVATNDCHYLNKEDADAHEVLLCIQTQTTMDDPKRYRFQSREFYYKSPEEMEKAFAHVPEAIANTAKIAEQCNVELDMGNHYFPVYALPEGTKPEDEFRRLAEEGLEKRLAVMPDSVDKDAYRERLQYEIKVILEMGFPGYFLIVQEFINWAKDHGIPVGPGRGSAAGSLVAWSMRITNLDPLPYNLLFERFLNIERVSLPDIDVDFCERRRTEVIQHMVERYGKDAVAQITTFGTMKARAAVRDVGRALGISLGDTNRIAKLVPEELKMTIDKALATVPELKTCYDTEPATRKLLDTARSLEGMTRHASTHAAGLVVSDKPMEEYLPLYRGKREELVTQFDGPMTEKTGLVKFDFLGLKTMTMIFDALDNIREQGLTPPDLDTLPLDDSATYDLYSSGETDGIFQVESSGMRKYLRMLRPSCFEDIIAMLALYRPGPLESNMVDEFIQRKHGRVEVKYPHDSLENCLKDTYGVIVYQEQVMQIAQIIAKYTLGGADLLRRAMGKKKPEEMAKQRTVFLKGAAENNIPEKTANEIFDLMEKFAAYGFNKSHSAAYALISYHTAWLKTHYKVEFMAALMTSEMGNQDKLLNYISNCDDMGIEVVPPQVNRSLWKFSAHEGKVVFGMGGIKNVGQAAIEDIVRERTANGPFTSLLDMLCRVNQKSVNKRTLEALIKAGACDCFGVTRAAMLAALPQAVTRAQKFIKDQNSAQASLLALAPEPQKVSLPGLGFECEEASTPEMPDEELLKLEKEVYGYFLTSHPLQPWKHELDRIGTLTLADLREEAKRIASAPPPPAPAEFKGRGKRPQEPQYSCALLATGISEKYNKNNELMCFLNVEDLTGRAEVAIFRNYTEMRDVIKSEQPLMLTVQIDRRSLFENDDAPESEEEENAPLKLKLICSGATTLQEASRSNTNPYPLQIPQNRLDEGNIKALKDILTNFHGQVAVDPWVELDDCRCHLRLDDLAVSPGPELDKAIANWVGKKARNNTPGQ